MDLKIFWQINTWLQRSSPASFFYLIEEESWRRKELKIFISVEKKCTLNNKTITNSVMIFNEYQFFASQHLWNFLLFEPFRTFHFKVNFLKNHDGKINLHWICTARKSSIIENFLWNITTRMASSYSVGIIARKALNKFYLLPMKL